jgi:hypothetical protein
VPVLLQKLQALAQLSDVASDQQSAGPTLKVEVDRGVAPVSESIPPWSIPFSTTPSVSAMWRGFNDPE